MNQNLLQFRLQDGGDRIAPSRGLEKRLNNEVRDEMDELVVTEVISNRDPVLRHVAPLAGEKYLDERVFSNMEKTESKVLDARRHLESEIFAHEFEIQQGPSSSRAAAMLQDFAEQLWCRVPNQQVVLQRMVDAYYYGWAPMQVLPDTEATFKGRSVWMPRKIVNKPHHKVRHLRDGGIVWAPWAMAAGGRRFSPEEAQLGWLTWQVGDLHHEYGRGLHSDAFLLVWAKKQMLRKFQTGVERQMGMMKVKNSAIQGLALDEEVEKVKEEIQTLLDVLNSHNVVIEAGQWGIEFLTDLNFIGGGLQTLEYLDERIMTLYVGEILTSNPGDRGTQALGTVHRSVKTDYAKQAAQQCIEEPITDLFRRYIVANFGEVDLDDLPRFISRMRLKVNIPTAQAVFDMGLPLKGRRLAELLGVGSIIASESDEEDEDEIILEKPSAPQLGLFPGQGEQDDEQDQQDEDDKMEAQTDRSLQRGANDQDEALDRLIGKAIGRADQSLRTYVDEMATEFLARNGIGDPPKEPAPE